MISCKPACDGSCKVPEKIGVENDEDFRSSLLPELLQRAQPIGQLFLLNRNCYDATEGETADAAPSRFISDIIQKKRKRVLKLIAWLMN